MKMKIDQKVYLQKYDIAFITHELSIIPAGLMNELFKDSRFFIMSDHEDGFVFDCVFEDAETVAWLMEQDWIVDYNQYKDIPPAEIKSICEKFAGEISVSAKNFNSRDEDYRSAHYDECKEELSKMTHKLDSIEAMVEYLEGKLNFVFPEQATGHSSIPKPTKKPGFFARLFGRGAQ